MGETHSQVFQVRVQMVDLQGAWLISPKKVLQSSISCSNVKAGDTPSLDANGAVILQSWASAMGRYSLDASGKTLVWARDPAAMPAGHNSIDFQMSGTVDLGMDGVRLRANADAPQKTNALPLAAAPMAATPPLLALGLALVGPPAAVVSWRASRRRLALVAMAAAIALLVRAWLEAGSVAADAAHLFDLVLNLRQNAA